MTDKTLLDPVEVLRRLTGTGAYVIVTFGSGATAKGSIVASDDNVSALLDHDATASFVRHEAVLAVTVREAHAFEGELQLDTGADALGTPATTPVPDDDPLTLADLQRLLAATGFEHDETAVLGADLAGRAGLATLAASVNEALRSIASDPEADAAMTKDVTGVRLVDGLANATDIDDRGVLVVTSPWSRGPGAVYDPPSLRAAILDAAS